MKKKAAITAPKPNVFQIVTDKFITSLKAGIIPWEKPWKTTRYNGGPFPRNFSTGRPYRGINVMLLWSSSYSSPFWLTFNQAKALNGTVPRVKRVRRSSFSSSYGVTNSRTRIRPRAKSGNRVLF